MVECTTPTSKGVAEAAEKQMRAWALRLEMQDRVEREDTAADLPHYICPFVAISRDVGAGASGIARLVGEQLQWEVLDRELLDYMAQQRRLSRLMLDSVDETRTSWLFEVFGKWLGQRIVTQSEYLAHLGRVVLMAAHDGSKIFVGRGAQFFLPRDRGVAIQIVAPRETRIQRVMKQRGIDATQAQHYVDNTDRSRREFVQRYFHHDVTDPRLYDLVVNTDRWSTTEVADLIVQRCRNRFN